MLAGHGAPIRKSFYVKSSPDVISGKASPPDKSFADVHETQNTKPERKPSRTEILAADLQEYLDSRRGLRSSLYRSSVDAFKPAPLPEGAIQTYKVVPEDTSCGEDPAGEVLTESEILIAEMWDFLTRNHDIMPSLSVLYGATNTMFEADLMPEGAVPFYESEPTDGGTGEE